MISKQYFCSVRPNFPKSQVFIWTAAGKPVICFVELLRFPMILTKTLSANLLPGSCIHASQLNLVSRKQCQLAEGASVSRNDHVKSLLEDFQFEPLDQDERATETMQWKTEVVSC